MTPEEFVKKIHLLKTELIDTAGEPIICVALLLITISASYMTSNGKQSISSILMDLKIMDSQGNSLLNKMPTFIIEMKCSYFTI